MLNVSLITKGNNLYLIIHNDIQEYEYLINARNTQIFKSVLNHIVTSTLQQFIDEYSDISLD